VAAAHDVLAQQVLAVVEAAHPFPILDCLLVKVVGHTTLDEARAALEALAAAGEVCAEVCTGLRAGHVLARLARRRSARAAGPACDGSVNATLLRLERALGVRTDAELARCLDISPECMCAWRMTGLVSTPAVAGVAVRHGIDLNWLLTGQHAHGAR